MAVVGVLEIQMAADLARLSNDMNRARRTVGSSVRTINNILGTIGVGISFAVIGRMIKDVSTLNQRYKELGISLSVVGRNVGIPRQELDKTAVSLQRLGISMIESRQTVLKLASANIDLAKAEQLADLARNAAIVGQLNTSDALSRIVHGIRSAELEVLKTIGITVSFENAYKDLAGQLGITTTQLTESQKQQARLNVVLDEAPALVGLYTAAMGNAGKQLRSTDRLVEDLKVRIGGLFDVATQNLVKAYTSLLVDLDDQITVLTDSGDFERWGDNIARVMAIGADSVRALGSVFYILGKQIGATAAQFVAMARLDFNAVSQIQNDFNADVQAEIDGLTKFQDAVESQIIQRKLLTGAVSGVSNAIKNKTETDEEEIKTTKKTKSASDSFIESLKKQAAQAGKTADEIRRMEAAQLGVLDAAKPYLKIIEDQAIAEEDLRKSREKQADDLRAIESVTKSVRTEQEIYNDKVAELDRLLGQGLGVDAYNRALAQAREELNRTRQTARDTFGDIDQFGVQAARNIQSSFAQAIAGGIKDFKSFADRIMDILIGLGAQIASTNILRGLGLGGAVGGSAAASGGFDIATMFKAGFGLPNVIGSGISSIGSLTGSGSLTAFGQAFGGDAIAAFAGEAGAFGASAGAAFSAAAGPALIGYATTQLFKSFAGDKRVGGGFGKALNAVGDVPILGDFLPVVPLLNSLFGRGPLKQKETNLIGDFTASGFSGVTSTKFKAQGGLLRGDKVDRIINDTDTGDLLNQYRELVEGGISSVLDPAAEQARLLALEIGSLLDESVKGISTSLRGVADNLGYSQDAIDNFSASINIASEKGQALSEEQIGEEIAKVADAMTLALIPNIKEFSQRGESAAATASRLNLEFASLAGTLEVIGVNASQAKELLRSIGFDQRSAIVDLAGGVDALNAKTQNLFSKLSESQQLDVLSDRLQAALKEVGIGFIPTLEQFTSAMVSGRLSVEQFIAGLNLQDLIVQVNALKSSSGVGVTDSLNARAGAAQIAFDQLSLSVEAERNKLTDQYNKDLEKQNGLIQKINDSVSQLSSLYDSLKSATQQLRPLGIGSARGQIQQAIAAARQGNFAQAGDLQQALQTITSQSTDGFASRADFLRDQAKSASLLDELSTLTDDQLTAEKRALQAAESSLTALTQGFTSELSRLDDILSDSKVQIDVMRGIDSSIKSLSDALLALKSATEGSGFFADKPTKGSFGLTIPQGLPNVSSPSPVSDQAIKDFIATNPNPQQLAQAAIATGVSSDRIASIYGLSSSQVDNFFKSNPNIAKFDVGGIVPRTGAAIIHKDERILTSDQNKDLVVTLKDILAEIKTVVANTGKSTKILDDVSAGGSAFLMENA